MATGDSGESKVLHELNQLRVKYPDHRIFPLAPTVSNPPYDIGIDIDGQFYRGQVKTTTQITPAGRMVFDTSRIEKGEDGKRFRVPYTSEDISFFFLYCNSPETEWLGIALLEECSMGTTVCKFGKFFKNSLRASDMEFEKRMRELIEEKKISPVPTYSEIETVEESEEPEKSKSAPVFKKPATDSELFNLLVEHGYDLDLLSDSIHVSVPTIQSWIQEYVC